MKVITVGSSKLLLVLSNDDVLNKMKDKKILNNEQLVRINKRKRDENEKLDTCQ